MVPGILMQRWDDSYLRYTQKFEAEWGVKFALLIVAK